MNPTRYTVTNWGQRDGDADDFGAYDGGFATELNDETQEIGDWPC